MIPVVVDAGIDRTLARIREDKKGTLTAGVSLQGLEFGVGYRPTSWFDIGGYAARQWGTGGWSAGARATVSF